MFQLCSIIAIFRILFPQVSSIILFQKVNQNLRGDRMAVPYAIDQDYLLEQLENLLKTPSPTGFTDQVFSQLGSALEELGLEQKRNSKGVMISQDQASKKKPLRALTAHLDTLGAVVKEIKPNGRLKLSKIGGFAWNTVEGENCTVFTRGNRAISGSLLLVKASGHIHGEEVGKTSRTDETMEVRIDERSKSSKKTRELGIEVGDFVTFDPRVKITKNGFIRSRHLDDKAGVACILAAVKAMQNDSVSPSRPTLLHFSNYEEVGHGGAAGLPIDLQELVAVDMAPVGSGQNSDEHHAIICMKDRGGPYDLQLTRHLIGLAEKSGIPYKLDVYPYYGSDGEAYWRAGGEARVALVGPGIDASHNYERSHLDSLTAVSQLLVEYLLN
jgi:putative aminopeptidase FrvX